MNLPVKYQSGIVTDDATEVEKVLMPLAVEFIRNSKSGTIAKKPTIAEMDEYWDDPEYRAAHRALRRSYPIK